MRLDDPLALEHSNPNPIAFGRLEWPK